MAKDGMAEIRKTLAEVARAQARTERELRAFQRDTDRFMATTEAAIQESREYRRAEAIRIKEEAAERDKERKAEEKRLATVRREWGDFTDGEGEMAEDEFAAALRAQKTIGKFRLKKVLQRLKNIHEYDLVCPNGSAVFVGEVKRRLTVRAVREFAEGSLPHFAEEFPGHARRRKVYGMVGGMRINPAAEREAAARGLILLRLKNRELRAERIGEARPV